MYFATTIAERKITEKENTLSGRWEKLTGRGKKKWKEITVKHTQRRYISYKKEIANGTICPVDITLKRLTKI